MNTNITTHSFLLGFMSLFSSMSYSGLSVAEAPIVKHSIEAIRKPASNTNVISGYEIPNLKNRMASIFPQATYSKKSDLLPSNFGGTSFTGLVARLLGEGLNKQFEGLNTKQIIYYGIEKDQTVGLAHAATSEFAGQLLHTIVFYTPGGTVKKVEVDGINEKIQSEFKADNILDQFAGYPTEDFEVIRGRKGKIVSRGTFLSKVKRPKSSEGRQIFEKVLRSVRYSAAFMDVAYFITQHPDQADKPTQEFPEGIELTNATPTSGPEAFVDKKNIASPIDGNPFHPEQDSESSSSEQ